MIKMFARSYEQMTDVSIMEVKTYLLIHSEGVYQQDIYDLMNKCLDVSQLKRKLNKRKDLQLWLFTTIKRYIDCSLSYNEMEYHLIMMNILIHQHFRPLVEYKYNLFYYILDKSSFNLETYCLLRHLLTFKMNQLNKVILGMTNYKMLSDEQTHYYASLILLLEKQYKQAYLHLPFTTIDESFKRFEKSLYNYSPYRYEMLYHKDKTYSLDYAR